MLLTLFDIGVLVVVSFSTLLGFMRRFSGEVFNILAWVFALFCTLHFTPKLAQAHFFQSEALSGFFSAQWVRYAVSSLVIFLSTYLLTRFCVSRIRLLFNGNYGFFSLCDRVLGLSYGLARGFVFCSILYWLIVWVSPSPAAWPDWVTHSRSRPLLAQGKVYIENVWQSFKESLPLQALFLTYLTHFESNEGESDKIPTLTESKISAEPKRLPKNKIIEEEIRKHMT